MSRQPAVLSPVVPSGRTRQNTRMEPLRSCVRQRSAPHVRLGPKPSEARFPYRRLATWHQARTGAVLMKTP